VIPPSVQTLCLICWSSSFVAVGMLAMPNFLWEKLSRVSLWHSPMQARKQLQPGKQPGKQLKLLPCIHALIGAPGNKLQKILDHPNVDKYWEGFEACTFDEQIAQKLKPLRGDRDKTCGKNLVASLTDDRFVSP